MKELSIEQKAAAYDKALEKFRKDIGEHELVGVNRAYLEDIFPELKESEDEKIRKEMIEVIRKESKEFPSSIVASKADTWIAYLEKQGEHANFRNKIQVGDEVTRNQDGVLVNLSQLKRVAKKDEKQGEQKPIDPDTLIQQRVDALADIVAEQKPTKEHDVCDFCEGRYVCVNHCPTKLIDEQKSAYKVEPKFKIGDVIIKKHNSDILYFGSFTITDITGGKYWYNDRIICDITEQDDWELYEPVSQKSAEWSEEDEKMVNGIITILKPLHETECDYNKYKNSLISWLKSIKDRVQPQSEQEFSEEDVKMLGLLFEMINYASDHYQLDDKAMDIKNWLLKSLRPQPKQEWLKELDKILETASPEQLKEWKEKYFKEDCDEWSEEDKMIKETIRCALTACLKTSKMDYKLDYIGYQQCINWLKSLRPQKQWKPSGEYKEAIQLIYDEKLIPFKDGNQWCFLLGYNIQEGVCGFGDSILEAAFEFYKEYTTTRKCIGELSRPQSYFSLWKPSDEQIEALSNALSLAKNCGEENAFDLRTLYEQLKKLREE